jgi:DNA-binding GntR family transcriptional regulator
MVYDPKYIPYLKIVDDISEAINAGRYKPGDRISTIKDIAEQYACNRTTAHKALTLLQERGYLVATPAGTRVAPANHMYRVLQELLNVLEKREEDPQVVVHNAVPAIVGRSATVRWFPDDEEWKLEAPQ